MAIRTLDSMTETALRAVGMMIANGHVRRIRIHTYSHGVWEYAGDERGATEAAECMALGRRADTYRVDFHTIGMGTLRFWDRVSGAVPGWGLD